MWGEKDLRNSHSIFPSNVFLQKQIEEDLFEDPQKLNECLVYKLLARDIFWNLKL